MILFHLAPAESGGVPLLSSGWVGVDMFFVLSGFLITGILLDGRGEPGQLKRFYVRRVLRIFPLYYATLAVMFFIVPLYTSDPLVIYPREEQPAYFLYLQNLLLPLIQPGENVSVYLSHTWSLAIEEQFYMLWPIMVVVLPRRVLGVFLGVLIITAPLNRYLILDSQPRNWAGYWLVYRNSLLHIDGLAVGSALALIVRRRDMSAQLLGRIGAVFALIALPAAFWALHQLSSAGIHHFPYQPSHPIMGAWMFSVLAIGFGGVLLACLGLRAPWLDPLLCNPAAVWLGRISYGLYVLHFPIILALRGTKSLPLIVCAILAAACASWFLLERPFLKLKDRLASSKQAPL